MSGDAEFEGPPEPPVSEKPAIEAEAPTHSEPVTPREMLRRAPAYLSLFDFAAKPTTKAGWAIRFFAVIVAAVVLYRRTLVVTHKLTSANAPSPIPTEEIDDYRFKLPERTRRDIFEELATAEIAERDRAIKANTWGGHLWSREDDRGYYERAKAQTLAAKYKVSLTQIYLVLDEGIREHWEGPDGKPLTPLTPPLNIRSNSW